MNKSAEEIQAVIRDTIPEGLIVAEHTEKGHFYRHTKTNQLFASVTTKSSGILETPHLKKWAARLAVDNFAASCNIPGIDIETLKTESILVHQDQFEDAGGIGTLGHKVIESYLDEWILKKEEPEKAITDYIEHDDPRLWAIARSADLFFKEYGFVPIASELLVASTRYKFAGTLDCLGLVVIPGRRCSQKYHQWIRASTSNPYKVICMNCRITALQRFALLDWKTSNSLSGKPEYAMQVSAYKCAFLEMTKLDVRTVLIVRFDKKQAKYEVVKIPDIKGSFTAFKNISRVYDWLENGKQKLEQIIQKEIVQIA